MNIDMIPSHLRRVAEKVLAETPVDEKDALAMLTTADVVSAVISPISCGAG